MRILDKNSLPYNKNNKALLMKKTAFNNKNPNMTQNQIRFKDKAP